MTIITKNYIQNHSTEFIIFIILFSLSLGLISFHYFSWYNFCGDDGCALSLSLISGDEPTVLALTSAIVNHQSIFLEDYYLDPNPDPRLKFPPPYMGETGNCTMWHGRIAEDGHCYSSHGLGPSIIAIPGYAIGGIFGAMVTMSVVFSLLGIMIFKLTSKLTTKRTGLITTLFFSFGTVLFAFSGEIHSEMPIGLILLSIMYLLFYKKTNSVNLALIGVLLGSMIFFKASFAIFFIIFIPVICYMVLTDKTNKKNIFYFFITFSAILLTFIIYESETQIVDLSRGQHGAFVERIPNLLERDFNEHLERISKGITNYLFGQIQGLFIFSPLVLLSFFGTKFAWKKNKLLTLTILLIFFTFLVIHTMFSIEGAKATIPGRYLIPLMPLIAIFLACLFDRISKNIVFQTFLFSSSIIGLQFNYLFGRVVIGHTQDWERVEIVSKVYYGFAKTFPYVTGRDINTVYDMWQNIHPLFWIYPVIIIISFFIFTLYPHSQKENHKNFC